MKWWGWILLGASLAVSAGLVVWYTLSGRSADARKAAIDMTVAWHKRDVEAQRARIEELGQDFARNEHKIRDLTTALQRKKAALETRYKMKGLSDAEIAERFRRIYV